VYLSQFLDIRKVLVWASRRVREVVLLLIHNLEAGWGRLLTLRAVGDSFRAPGPTSHLYIS
jgi:hypothetical protein